MAKRVSSEPETSILLSEKEQQFQLQRYTKLYIYTLRVYTAGAFQYTRRLHSLRFFNHF